MFMELAVAAACAAGANPAAAPIRAARDRFNRAIAEKNYETIAGMLADDVVLVTGTDSELFEGRKAQIEIWRKDFADPGRLVYVRTPSCISLSPLYPIASETGTWRGAPESASDAYIGGEYAAKWRLVDDRWILEAEIYVTMSCGGTLCPEPQEETRKEPLHKSGRADFRSGFPGSRRVKPGIAVAIAGFAQQRVPGSLGEKTPSMLCAEAPL